MLRYLALGERELGDAPMPPHPRVNWEFFAVVKGQVAPYTKDSDPIDLKSDTLWLFPPGVVHGWRGKRGQKCEVVVIHFSIVPGVVERAFGDEPYLSVQLTPLERSRIVRLGRALKPHYWNPIVASELFADRARIDLSLLLLKGRRELQEPNLAGVHWNKVSEAEAWLRKNIGKAPSIADAAHVVGLSESQLRRIFWKVKRRNPKHILDKLRFDKAMHLMAESDAKLAKIAEESGFSSATNFCRAFRAYVGKTPTAWRREIYIKYQRPSDSDKASYERHGRRHREL
ncbi:MAG TPA: AraC family transcriptional regulator [Opitutaceae bacterium]|nr:AraC family transcriptional regulator [Opitutaceae bacterium]